MKRENVELMAKASWMVPLLVVGISVVASSPHWAMEWVKLVVGGVGYPLVFVAGFMLCVLALVMGVVAQVYVPKFGPKKIMVHALVGTILSTGMIVLVVVFVTIVLPLVFQAWSNAVWSSPDAP